MTLRERILAAFHGVESDVIPWFADLTYWYSAQVLKEAVPKEYKNGREVVTLYRDLGCGAHEDAVSTPYKISYEDVKIIVTKRKDKDGLIRELKKEWITPVGTLRQIHEYSLKSFSWAVREYPIKSITDLRILRFIYKHQKVC